MSVKPNIAVVGDIMIDVDVHCAARRLSQDGPWPVLNVERVTRRMGGAGNVREMLLALGSRALLFGIVGEEDFETIPATGSTGGWVAKPGLTTTKTRYWVDGRLTGPRVDVDNPHRINTSAVINHWRDVLSGWNPDAIIVADHGKGVINDDRIMEMLSNFYVPIFVDPIASTPLPRHVAAICGGVHELGQTAWKSSQCLITKRGADGLTWKTHAANGTLPAECRNLVDPLGAGDQFIAALAYQRCLGTDWPQAIEWANTAAGIQCERPGCVPIIADEIMERVKLSPASAV